MNKEFHSILNNIKWLLFDKLLILILEFFIGVKVANYYGASSFGQYSYAISLVAFSNIFFELINSRVLKKYYTKNNFNILVFNVNFFKNSIAIILFFIPIIYKFFYKIDNTLFYLLLLLCLDNILMTATSGIENFFEYKLEAKRIVISNNIVKIISYFLQYICMILNKGIIFIAIVRCIGSLIRVIILKFQYSHSYLRKLENKSVKLDIKLIVKIIDESKYLWFSFVSFLIYTQTDRLMINYYLGIEEVGVYTIGMQLSNILAILIGPIQNSLFPKFLELYRNDYQKYYSFYKLTNTIITQFYLIITLISIIVVKYTFKYVYSSQYDGAILIYSILAFSVFIKANGSLQTSHMTIKNITKKSFYKTLVSLILNIILNILLIPKYGINGAAIATLITQFIALFLIDFFIKEYQEQAIIQLKSLNLIYLIKEIKKHLKKE
jgi:O-antigen/teichoic acid export membrane protein